MTFAGCQPSICSSVMHLPGENKQNSDSKHLKYHRDHTDHCKQKQLEPHFLLRTTTSWGFLYHSNTTHRCLRKQASNHLVDFS